MTIQKVHERALRKGWSARSFTFDCDRRDDELRLADDEDDTFELSIFR